MERLSRFTLVLTAALTSAAVALTNEVLSTVNGMATQLQIFMIFLVLVVFSTMSAWLVPMLISQTKLRRWILRESWVEGYWALYEEGSQGQEIPAIAQIRHHTSEGLSTTVHRLGEGRRSVTVSVAATIDSRGFYVNRFESRGEDKVAGVSAGQFIFDELAEESNQYDGQIFYFSANKPRLQHGWKLSKDWVLKLQAANPVDWWGAALRELAACYRDGEFNEDGFEDDS